MSLEKAEIAMGMVIPTSGFKRDPLGAPRILALPAAHTTCAQWGEGNLGTASAANARDEAA